MWNYEKRLEYPVNIKNVNPAMAKLIITQLGGPDGEMGAATRYLSQRYSAPYAEVKATLTDIGSEEAKKPAATGKIANYTTTLRFCGSIAAMRLCCMISLAFSSPLTRQPEKTPIIPQRFAFVAA